MSYLLFFFYISTIIIGESHDFEKCMEIRTERECREELSRRWEW